MIVPPNFPGKLTLLERASGNVRFTFLRDGKSCDIMSSRCNTIETCYFNFLVKPRGDIAVTIASYDIAAWIYHISTSPKGPARRRLGHKVIALKYLTSVRISWTRPLWIRWPILCVEKLSGEDTRAREDFGTPSFGWNDWWVYVKLTAFGFTALFEHVRAWNAGVRGGCFRIRRQFKSAVGHCRQEQLHSKKKLVKS